MPSFGRQASCAYASAAIGSILTPLARHDEIGIPSAALGTAQQSSPVRYGHSGAVLRNLGNDVGLGSFIV